MIVSCIVELVALSSPVAAFVNDMPKASPVGN